MVVEDVLPYHPNPSEDQILSGRASEIISRTLPSSLTPLAVWAYPVRIAVMLSWQVHVKECGVQFGSDNDSSLLIDIR